MHGKKSLLTAVLAVLLAVSLLVPAAWASSRRRSGLVRPKFTVLYDFGLRADDPLEPEDGAVIAQGRDGNFYTTTVVGGAYDLGTVFKITPAGKLTVLYNFDDPVGGPDSGLTLGTDGYFYGACIYCGDDYGTTFRITPSGDLTTLYEFTGQDDNAYPRAPPIEGSGGEFYGTAAGDFYGNGGEVYKMTPSGSKVALFHLDHEQGAAPADPLVQGTDGDFYATTNGGGSGNCGSAGCGVIFKVTSQGQVAVLHEFDSSQNDGFQPVAPLIEANDGVFYGTVPYGAPGANGAAFTITAAGKFALLHVFRGQTDGRYPYAALVQATDGNYYGTTCLGGSDNKGVIFRISAEGKFSVIHEFDGADGDQPQVALVQHTNGKLYGDTFEGGSMNHGVFYSLDIGAGPFVGLVSTAGKVGEQVGILGQGFMAATGVEFNGVAAKFTVASDTYLAATVPEGATTGFVTVATRDGRLKSNKKFYVRK